MQNHNHKIVGILYQDDNGNFCVLNEVGLLHDLLIEIPDGLPIRPERCISIPVLSVDWGDSREYWAQDLWEDLLHDMQSDGQDVSEIREKHKDKAFNALLIG